MDLSSNNLSKTFVPCRSVLEMEILTSLFLATSNYENIKELPLTNPSSSNLIKILKMEGNIAQEKIVQYFIDVILSKLKPIVMYERDHHDRIRMGNVAPSTKTRNCVFFALHRLKTKFLILKNFIDEFRKSDGSFGTNSNPSSQTPQTLLEALRIYYLKKNKENLESQLPKEMVSQRVKDLLDDKNAITNERLIDMATYVFYQEQENIVKYFMREIKASIFVCKLMLVKIDIKNPFNRGIDVDVNEEDFMISNDFLPELLPKISKCYAEKKYLQLKDLFVAYDFLMSKVLNGINFAYEVASGKEIILKLEETLYPIM